MYIKICSLKMLYYLLEEKRIDVAASRAIIVASETPLRPKKLGSLNYIYAPFDDVTQGEGKLTPQLAHRIVSYYDDISEDCEMLFVVCDAGQSRSAAIAAAILKVEGQDNIEPIWANPKYQPNPHVYRTMCQAFGIQISNLALKRLSGINTKAYRQAIQSQKQ